MNTKLKSDFYTKFFIFTVIPIIVGIVLYFDGRAASEKQKAIDNKIFNIEAYNNQIRKNIESKEKELARHLDIVSK